MFGNMAESQSLIASAGDAGLRSDGIATGTVTQHTTTMCCINSNLCYTRVAITRMRTTATATQRAPRSAGRLFQHTIEFDARTWPGPDIQVVWRRVPQT